MLEKIYKKIFQILFPHAIISYSQSGEDVILWHLFKDKKNGFYVDIGAHAPKRFSNTHLLYKQGWSGINIDPIPGMKEAFAERTRDTNINAGVSDHSGTMEYYAFSKGAVNTFDKTIAEKQSQKFGKPNILNVHIQRLDEILHDTHVTAIDFMNIDVEGHELAVLKSNDWNAYSPTILAIEDQELDITHPEKSETYLFLKEKNYILFNKINYTAFYRKI